jgi:subtilisin family serine protease
VTEPDLSGSVTGILEKLPEQTPTPYYGATAWKGYVRQPAASIIRTSDAQGQYGSGAGVVAIIDTGVDAHHPVFGGHVLPGYDFTRDRAGDASDLSDLDGSVTAILEAAPDSSALGFDILNGSVTAILEGSVTAILETNSALPQAFGHGTMVAGLVHLVAPTANILPLKAFRADGSSTLFEIVRAIYYATDNGARVINMSFSLAKDSRALARAIKYATDHGVLVVAAAGNARSNVNVFPAAYSNATGVASTTNLDVRSAFTNYGSSIASLAAPGEQLVTTFPAGRYAVASGTSFSSGLVSGLASLLVQNAPAIKQGDFENSLGKGSKKINQDVGQGRLDLYKTLQEYLKR